MPNRNVAAAMGKNSAQWTLAMVHTTLLIVTLAFDRYVENAMRYTKIWINGSWLSMQQIIV
jgi:hypothetical protein